MHCLGPDSRILGDPGRLVEGRGKKSGNLRRYFSLPDLFPLAPTNSPWVSEDGTRAELTVPLILSRTPEFVEKTPFPDQKAFMVSWVICARLEHSSVRRTLSPFQITYFLFWTRMHGSAMDYLQIHVERVCLGRRQSVDEVNVRSKDIII